ncbi:hypothetical protein ACIQXI_14275 [Lysinibacillus sp. NPDC097195]|uniref:hypothetical protein n=1 Tax=Lysinibacillus sp. NPDC097195 TaxID=3364141 RepID=UPI00381EF409
MKTTNYFGIKQTLELLFDTYLEQPYASTSAHRKRKGYLGCFRIISPVQMTYPASKL